MNSTPKIIPSFHDYSTKDLSFRYCHLNQILEMIGLFDKYKFSVENSDYVISREPDRITVFENC